MGISTLQPRATHLSRTQLRLDADGVLDLSGFPGVCEFGVVGKERGEAARWGVDED